MARAIFRPTARPMSRPAAVTRVVTPRIVPKAPQRPKSIPQKSVAKPLPVRKQVSRVTPTMKKAPQGKIGGRLSRKVTQTPTMKPKGVISGAKKLAGAVSPYLPGIGKVAGMAVSMLPDGTPVMVKRKRRRGLTYSEIRGANRVLKLVKKFAPAGSKFKLKSKRRSA